MPRNWSTNLQEIHKAYHRRDTLDLYLNDGTELHLSRGAVLRGLTSYNNSIASVEDLRERLEGRVDTIKIHCQNVDSELGLNLASGLRLLDYAVADYGKIYQSERNPALIEDIPQFFRGVLANAEADEERISFELIVDYESLGSIIASRALAQRCRWLYKNLIECTSTSVSPICQKTRSACKKNAAEKDFGGWEFFEEPVSNLPGDGGNSGGGLCFLGSTRIWTPNGFYTFEEIKSRFQLGIKSIYSFNPHTGEIEVDEIEEIFVHQSNGYFTFDFDHAKVNVTHEHPFLTDWGIFRPADGFSRLDTTKTISKDGKWFDSRLQKIKWNSDVQETVYNCRVKKNATYFADFCAVHNSKNIEIILD